MTLALTANIKTITAQTNPKVAKQNPYTLVYEDAITENVKGKVNIHPDPGQEQWRAALTMEKLWRDAVNKHGGDVTLVHLPEIEIMGNTHFPFSDLNTHEIASLMSKWLTEKQLDK